MSLEQPSDVTGKNVGKAALARNWNEVKMRLWGSILGMKI